MAHPVSWNVVKVIVFGALESVMSLRKASSPRFDSKSDHAIPDWGNLALTRDRYLLADLHNY